MKYLQFAVIVFVLYFLGYILGPTITPMLVDEQEPKNPLLREVAFKGAVYPINLREYRGDDLPKEITMAREVTIKTIDGAGEVRLSEGETVTLLNRDGDQLLVAKPESNAQGAVEPDDTDIYEVLARMKFAAALAEGGEKVAEVPREAEIPAVMPDGQSRPKPEPAPVAVVEPEPAPEPTVVEPMPEPEPKPTPVAKTNLSDEEIIELMKKSIGAGAVKEFSLEQVKGWKVTGEETIDGTTYQTGLAAYEAETIFGLKPVQAKALIKDGKVERWVYAKSGMEIQ
jgi:hypothetical protein